MCAGQSHPRLAPQPPPGTRHIFPGILCFLWLLGARGCAGHHQTLTQAERPPLGTANQGHHQQAGSGDGAQGRSPSSLPAETMLSPSPGALSTPFPACAAPVASVTCPRAGYQTCLSPASRARQGQQQDGSARQQGRGDTACPGMPAAGGPTPVTSRAGRGEPDLARDPHPWGARVRVGPRALSWGGAHPGARIPPHHGRQTQQLCRLPPPGPTAVSGSRNTWPAPASSRRGSLRSLGRPSPAEIGCRLAARPQTAFHGVPGAGTWPCPGGPASGLQPRRG